jgi:hypothetical protein
MIRYFRAYKKQIQMKKVFAILAVAGLMTACNNAEKTHTIGEYYGGGRVFWVTTDDLHGLIAETIDQSTSSNWYDAQNIISINSNHSTDGQLYTDWRLPTKNELNLMFLERTTVVGDATIFYWSFSEYTNDLAWSQIFIIGFQLNYFKIFTFYVRAVRAF